MSCRTPDGHVGKALWWNHWPGVANGTRLSLIILIPLSYFCCRDRARSPNLISSLTFCRTSLNTDRQELCCPLCSFPGRCPRRTSFFFGFCENIFAAVIQLLHALLCKTFPALQLLSVLSHKPEIDSCIRATIKTTNHFHHSLRQTVYLRSITVCFQSSVFWVASPRLMSDKILLAWVTGRFWYTCRNAYLR